MFRNENVSKLVVIDDRFKIEGVFTYYDLISALMAPLEKENKTIKSSEIMPQRNQSIQYYVSVNVNKMKETEYLEELLHNILTKKYW